MKRVAACGLVMLAALVCGEEKSVTEKPKFTNKLAGEKSPYLLQHAHNPVDWYPWGEEAFAKARKENKPIFLSVGYSTCHWCHVMEHESFENEAIAKVLNENFVSIKVDREERPDIDRVYMTFVQATTGGGGWPMSVFLTPELKPFFGGTYFPPENFAQILGRVGDLWKNDHERIAASADELTKALQQASAARPTTAGVEAALLDDCFLELKSVFEPRYGGFGGAPKFPRPVALNFMLRYYARSGKKDALDMTLHTLNKMADGGMHDHIGGGFHRYSVDQYWHVPHFEKMLYDQAQLAVSYLEAYQITREPFYADTARDILEYVLRDMTGKDGQFYSAEDADSADPKNPTHKVEGAFYVWEEKEIIDALGKDAAVFNYYYGVQPHGNAPSDPQGEFKNKNILIVQHDLDETAKKFHKTPDEISKILSQAHSTLFELRSKRPRPHLDDKTLTAWNAMMISAFARASQALDDSKYLAAAQRATTFIESHLTKDGKLLRRYRDGQSAVDAYLDDYSALIQSLLDLYEASFDVHYLTWALDLQKKQDELFWDAAGGGYYHTEAAAKDVLVRLKEDYDGAEPAPNSVAALNLLRLAEMTDNKDLRAKAEKTLAAFAARLGQNASAMPQMLVALDFSLSKPKQIIIAGQPDAADTRAMLCEIHTRFIPNKILLLADGGDSQRTLAKLLPFIETLKPIGGKATAHVCQNYTCQLPTNDLAVMAKQLVGEQKGEK